MNKKDLSERDFCTKFITPALSARIFGATLHQILATKYHFIVIPK